jgi:hypothetical protein
MKTHSRFARSDTDKQTIALASYPRTPHGSPVTATWSWQQFMAAVRKGSGVFCNWGHYLKENFPVAKDSGPRLAASARNPWQTRRLSVAAALERPWIVNARRSTGRAGGFSTAAKRSPAPAQRPGRVVQREQVASLAVADLWPRARRPPLGGAGLRLISRSPAPVPPGFAAARRPAAGRRRSPAPYHSAGKGRTPRRSPAETAPDLDATDAASALPTSKPVG